MSCFLFTESDLMHYLFTVFSLDGTLILYYIFVSQQIALDYALLLSGV